jgi:Arc/MetJ family transcription regulator
VELSGIPGNGAHQLFAFTCDSWPLGNFFSRFIRGQDRDTITTRPKSQPHARPSIAVPEAFTANTIQLIALSERQTESAFVDADLTKVVRQRAACHRLRAECSYKTLMGPMIRQLFRMERDIEDN